MHRKRQRAGKIRFFRVWRFLREAASRRLRQRPPAASSYRRYRLRKQLPPCRIWGASRADRPAIHRPRLSLLEERLILRAVVTRVLPLRTPCVSVSGEGTAVAGAAALGIAAPLAPMTIARAAAVRFIAAPAPRNRCSMPSSRGTPPADPQATQGAPAESHRGTNSASHPVSDH